MVHTATAFLPMLMEVPQYDAFLLVSFGGPERAEDVMPFLRNVVSGKPVPDERLAEVAQHYFDHGGKSPIQALNRQLVQALETTFADKVIPLSVAWGNRNWSPYLNDAIQSLALANKQRVMAFVTSAYSSYSGCRQYQENIDAALKAVNETGLQVPTVNKIRVFFDHPLWLKAWADRVVEAIAKHTLAAPELELWFTAHSIPQKMADGCEYVQQLEYVADDVHETVAKTLAYEPFVKKRLVYQSRSGSPRDPWLGPDINDALLELSKQSETSAKPGVVVVPIGFMADHMEVIHDLDVEAASRAKSLGIPWLRVPTLMTESEGIHPYLIEMIVDLVDEMQAQRIPASTRYCGPSCCVYVPGGPPGQRVLK